MLPWTENITIKIEVHCVMAGAGLSKAGSKKKKNKTSRKGVI